MVFSNTMAFLLAAAASELNLYKNKIFECWTVKTLSVYLFAQSDYVYSLKCTTSRKVEDRLEYSLKEMMSLFFSFNEKFMWGAR